MAGEDPLNTVDYPPLPPVNQKLNKKQQIPTCNSQDRNKPSSSKNVIDSETSPPGNHVAVDLFVGSIRVPSLSDHTKHQPQKQFRVDVQKSKPPPSCVVPFKDIGQQIGVEDDKSQHISSSKIAQAFYEPSNLQSRNLVNGIQCLTLNSCDKIRLLSKTKNIVIVKFSHLRPPFKDFETFLLNLKFTGKFKISSYDKKHVFVEFVVFEDYVKLWMLGSRFICGFLARFFSWDCDFNPDVESFIASVWIHLPGLPLYLFDEEVMLSLALIFGKPLFLDPLCLNHDKVGQMSLCVAMDVRVKRQLEFIIEFVGNGLLVERVIQKVVYGVVPSFCSNCMHLGHEFGCCKAPLNSDLRGLIEERKSKLQDASLLCNETVQNVPVISVFDRLKGRGNCVNEHQGGSGSVAETMNVVADVREEKEELMHTNCILPQVDNKVVEGLESIGEEHGKEARTLAKDTQATGLLMSKSVTVMPLEPTNITPGAIEQGVVAGDSNLLPKVAFKISRVEESGVKELCILSGKQGNSELSADPLSDSFNDPTLEAANSTPGAVEQGFLLGASSMLHKDVVQAVNVVKSDGEEHNFEPVKPADGSQTTGQLNTISDSYVAPSLRPQISDPGTEVQGLMVEDNSMINYVEVRAVKDQKTTVADLDFVAETSAAELLVADQNLSTVGIPSPGPPSHGSLLGTSSKVLKWLGQNVGQLIQDNLQQNQAVKVDATPPIKVVIKDPVSKEIIHLPSKTTPSCTSDIKSPVGLSKNAKKKWKKKQKKQDPQSSLSAVQHSIVSTPEAGNDTTQEHITRDSFYSSDTSLEGCQVSTLQKAYHIAAASIDSTAIKEFSQPQPALEAVDQVTDNSFEDKSSDEQVSNDTSQEQLDHLPLLEAYHKGHFDVQVTHSKKYPTKEAIPRKAALSSSLGVKVTVKNKVKEAEDSIEKATDDKVPKELFFFPPRPFTPAGVPSKYGRKKFNKEFLKPP